MSQSGGEEKIFQEDNVTSYQMQQNGPHRDVYDTFIYNSKE